MVEEATDSEVMDIGEPQLGKPRQPSQQEQEREDGNSARTRHVPKDILSRPSMAQRICNPLPEMQPRVAWMCAVAGCGMIFPTVLDLGIHTRTHWLDPHTLLLGGMDLRGLEAAGGIMGTGQGIVGLTSIATGLGLGAEGAQSPGRRVQALDIGDGVVPAVGVGGETGTRASGSGVAVDATPMTVCAV